MANKNISFPVSLIGHVELRLCFYLFHAQISITADETQKVLSCDETLR